MMDEAYDFIIQQLENNDLLAGGAILGSLAYLANYAKVIPSVLMKWGKRVFITQLDIPDRAESFSWINDWISEHKYAKTSKRITIEAWNSTGNKPKITPAPGIHFLWWRRRPMLINRIRNEGTGDHAHRAFRETWAITMFGKRKYVEDFIQECRRVSHSEQDSFIKIKEGQDGYWSNSTSRRKRDISTVLLPEGVRTKLMGDLNNFINSKDWYQKMSIPWRRGYLLSGPPGNGKSSIITAVASEVDFSIYTLNLRTCREEELTTLMGELGEKVILLLEDIDCAFEEREGKTNISLSVILNLLDGVNATEGRIVFMTTNHPEKLDEALIRPGRIDLHLELPNANDQQIQELFNRFFPTSKERLKINSGVSMAILQGYLLRYRHSVEDALANTKELDDTFDQ